VRLFDRAHAPHFVHAREAQRPAFLDPRGRIADAVHVDLRIGRDIDVDHRLQLRDIEPARGNVRGDQYEQLRLANCTST